MKNTLTILFTALLVTPAAVSAASVQDKMSPETSQNAKARSAPWKLLFSGAEDMTDTWGSLHFGVTPVRRLRVCEPRGFTIIGSFPLPGGAWEVFGQRMTEIRSGDEPYDRISEFSLLRATTRDGERFGR